MIRRDFVLRSIQQMVQTLARILHLKDRREYEQALREVGQALREFAEIEPGKPCARSLEEWIALCRKHPESAGGVMLAVADLLIEQGNLFSTRGQPAEAAEAWQLALGLLIEALLKEECFVTAQLVAKVETLIGQCKGNSLSPAVLRRLVSYFEVRGHFARAENALYEWLETGDADAAAAGRDFYERLSAMSDEALSSGGLSRAEAVQGAQDWLVATRARG